MPLIFFLTALLFCQNSQANVVGVDSQNFNPTSNGIDFVTVQSSETLSTGILNFGWFLNYAINTLPNYQNIQTQRRDNLRDKLLSSDLSLGVGLLRNWDMGLTIPQTLHQDWSQNSNVPGGYFSKLGVNEYRLNTKYRFFGDSNGGLATVFSVNWFTIENYPFTGVNPGPTFNFELAYDFTYEKVNIGTNLGYRKRNPGTAIPNSPVEPVGDQVIYSFGVSYHIANIDTKFISEVFGSIPMDSSRFISDRDLSSSEVLMGAKWSLTSHIDFHAGAGTELYHGSSSPDWRVYTGINYSTGPLFGKNEYEGNSLLSLLKLRADQAPQKNEVFATRDVLFEFNSDRIKPQFLKTLELLAKHLLKEKGFKSLVIKGHTDSVGSLKYNDQLSVKRSLSVRRELTKMLPEKEHIKIRARGFGERKPIYSNENYQGRSMNRRVEFQIKR